MNPVQIVKKLRQYASLAIPVAGLSTEAYFLKISRDARRYQQLRKKNHDTEVCIRNFERMGGAFENLSGRQLDQKLDNLAKKNPNPTLKEK